MAQFYSDPKRESDKWALPDCEVFQIAANDPDWRNEDGEMLEAGWYYWYCLPGCMPDSDPFGPFETRELAIADARENAPGCDEDED